MCVCSTRCLASHVHRSSRELIPLLRMASRRANQASRATLGPCTRCPPMSASSGAPRRASVSHCKTPSVITVSAAAHISGHRKADHLCLFSVRCAASGRLAPTGTAPMFRATCTAVRAACAAAPLIGTGNLKLVALCAGGCGSGWGGGRLGGRVAGGGDGGAAAVSCISKLCPNAACVEAPGW